MTPLIKRFFYLVPALLVLPILSIPIFVSNVPAVFTQFANYTIPALLLISVICTVLAKVQLRSKISTLILLLALSLFSAKILYVTEESMRDGLHLLSLGLMFISLSLIKVANKRS